MAQREVWFSRGSLFDAIRASIAIPTVFRPHHYEGRLLVDGGLLNPVPITPTLRDLTDCTIAVDVNAPAEPHQGEGAVDVAPGGPVDDVTFGSATPPLEDSDAQEEEPVQSKPEVPALPAETNAPPTYRQKIADFLDGMKERREKKAARASGPGIVELFARSLDTVQETVTRFKLAAQPPDLVIPIPRNTAAFSEFHRAEELIEFGRQRTREVLRNFRPPRRAG
jgi:NTE family protein